MAQKGISSILIILIIAGVLVAAGGVWYWQSQKEKAVSLEEILSNPSKYNNKTVITEGFYFRGFETNVFCRGLEYSGYATGHIRPAEPVIWIEDTKGVIKKEIIDKLYEQKMMGPTENYGKVKIKGYFESDGKYGHLGGYNYQLIPLEIEVLEWSLPEEIPGDETTTWKTYRNEEYRFEVKYPPTLKLWENQQQGTTIYAVSFENPLSDSKLVGRKIVFSVDIFNNPIDLQEEVSSLGLEDQGEAVIGGYQAKKLFRPQAPNDVEATVYLIAQKSTAIIVFGTDLHKISEAEINQILSTFKFIK